MQFRSLYHHQASCSHKLPIFHTMEDHAVIHAQFAQNATKKPKTASQPSRQQSPRASISRTPPRQQAATPSRQQSPRGSFYRTSPRQQPTESTRLQPLQDSICLSPVREQDTESAQQRSSQDSFRHSPPRERCLTPPREQRTDTTDSTLLGPLILQQQTVASTNLSHEQIRALILGKSYAHCKQRIAC